jgi:hypothetical protein
MSYASSLFWRLVSTFSCDLLVQKEWFANVLDFGNGAFQIEGFREDDLEDLLLVSVPVFDGDLLVD